MQRGKLWEEGKIATDASRRQQPVITQIKAELRVKACLNKSILHHRKVRLAGCCTLRPANRFLKRRDSRYREFPVPSDEQH